MLYIGSNQSCSTSCNLLFIAFSLHHSRSHWRTSVNKNKNRITKINAIAGARATHIYSVVICSNKQHLEIYRKHSQVATNIRFVHMVNSEAHRMRSMKLNCKKSSNSRLILWLKSINESISMGRQMANVLACCVRAHFSYSRPVNLCTCVYRLHIMSSSSCHLLSIFIPATRFRAIRFVFIYFHSIFCNY